MAFLVPHLITQKDLAISSQNRNWNASASHSTRALLLIRKATSRPQRKHEIVDLRRTRTKVCAIAKHSLVCDQYPGRYSLANTHSLFERPYPAACLLIAKEASQLSRTRTRSPHMLYRKDGGPIIPHHTKLSRVWPTSISRAWRNKQQDHAAKETHIHPSGTADNLAFLASLTTSGLIGPNPPAPDQVWRWTGSGLSTAFSTSVD